MDPIQMRLSGASAKAIAQIVLQPGGSLPAQFPAVRIPAADAARARADPDQTAMVLVQREDLGVRQRPGILGIMAVVMELVAAAIQQVQPLAGADPQISGLVLENGAHVIARQRAGILRIVTIDRRDVAAAVHQVQPTIDARHPQRAAAILQYMRNARAAQGAGIARQVAQMREAVLLRLPAIQAREGRHPHGAGAIELEPLDAIIRERVRHRAASWRRCVKRPVAGSRISTPASEVPTHTRPRRIDEHAFCTESLASEAGPVRIVAVDREGIAGTVPAGQARILDGHPQIVVGILDHVVNEISRQAAAAARGVGVAQQFTAVVADQPVLGGQPHEPLGVLQRRIDGALRQAVRGGQMLRE